MKKVRLLCLIICVSMLISIMCLNVKIVMAENNENYSVVLSGVGNYSIDADTAELEICIKGKNATSQTAKQDADESLQNVFNALSEFDLNLDNTNLCEFLYPIRSNHSVYYEYIYCGTIKTSLNNLEKIKEILKANNVKINKIFYTSSIIKDAYINALNNAKQDAEQKANKLNENLKLIKLVEQNYFLTSTNSSNITINAYVMAIFENENSNS